MRCLLACALLLTPTVEAGHLVVLYGTPGSDGGRTSAACEAAGQASGCGLEFLADESSLAEVELGGVRGAELLDLRGDALRRQREVYQAAMATSGHPDLPLVVVIDPSSRWVSAAPWRSLRYAPPGEALRTLTLPFLRLGGSAAWVQEDGELHADVVALNRRLLAGLRALRGAAPALGVSEKKLGRALGKIEFQPIGEEPYGIDAAAQRTAPPFFARTLREALAPALPRQGDPEAAWEALLEGLGIGDLEAEVRRLHRVHSMAGMVAHELGHVIHFAALGPGAYRAPPPAPHMDGGRHSMQLLSTQAFAFVEGWATGHSMVVAEEPPEEGALAIDYRHTLQILRSHLAGDPENRADLEARLAYVQELQTRKGEPRGRYDLLRSEFAVGAVLARLRRTLGPSASSKVLGTLHRHDPRSLGQLLEHFAHDHPEQRQAFYLALAAASEGILVDPSILPVSAGELDIDGDGCVPAGRPAQGSPSPLTKDPLGDPSPPCPVPGANGDPAWGGLSGSGSD